MDLSLFAELSDLISGPALLFIGYVAHKIDKRLTILEQRIKQIEKVDNVFLHPAARL